MQLIIKLLLGLLLSTSVFAQEDKYLKHVDSLLSNSITKCDSIYRYKVGYDIIEAKEVKTKVKVKSVSKEQKEVGWEFKCIIEIKNKRIREYVGLRNLWEDWKEKRTDEYYYICSKGIWYFMLEDFEDVGSYDITKVECH